MTSFCGSRSQIAPNCTGTGIEASRLRWRLQCSNKGHRNEWFSSRTLSGVLIRMASHSNTNTNTNTNTKYTCDTGQTGCLLFTPRAHPYNQESSNVPRLPIHTKGTQTIRNLSMSPGCRTGNIRCQVPCQLQVPRYPHVHDSNRVGFETESTFTVTRLTGDR